ncbi:LOB domain-containing protein 21-like [Nicotiana tomentosiformis]|uniref:LOB domain-containing protein 21-like n=1 Tax=Nicotiana tabacum TaxID=4097 RepID=A0A1S4DDS3_TOBAC|nr:LOB domain-containing protein 21-like [Nicotiana tomentosiformis]XP_016511359.1 PREDICTED: LOB domain-containing protein 21-like [Nicotiana tabacum]
MKSNESRSSSSCAACKFLKRRCTSNCQFAPYFRSDEPKKFTNVHKVFGASNVIKILNEVPQDQREDTVNSLVYEAEVRLRDPVYGCIGAIASLQRKMVELQHDLMVTRAHLAYYEAKPRPSTSCSFLDYDPLNVNVPSVFVDTSLSGGFLDNFSQNSFGMDHSGSTNEFGQFPFP